MSLTCDVVGDNPLEVLWKMRNGDILKNTKNGKYYIENKKNSEGVVSILSITSLELEDQGVYICLAVSLMV